MEEEVLIHPVHTRVFGLGSLLKISNGFIFLFGSKALLVALPYLVDLLVQV